MKGTPQADFPKSRMRFVNVVRFLLHGRVVSSVVPFLAFSPEGYDCILNDAFRPEPWIVALMLMRFGSDRLINVLHGNAPYWASIAKLSNHIPISFGALNRGMLSRLSELGWRAFHTPNAIRFGPEAGVVSEPDRRLIFIGRVAAEKGVHHAISVSRMAGIPLDIFGKIQDPRYFLSHIKPAIDHTRVEFYERANRTFLEERLRRSAALLHCGPMNEPFGMVVLEALRFGVPVLALKPGPLSGINDLCTSTNSFICDSTDAMAESALALDKFSRRGIYFEARAAHSWPVVVERSLAPLINAIAEREYNRRLRS